MFWSKPLVQKLGLGRVVLWVAGARPPAAHIQDKFNSQILHGAIMSFFRKNRRSQRVLSLPILATAALATAGLASAESAYAKKPKSDQQSARDEIRAGKQLSLRQIEQKVLPMMKSAEYLGPAYDSVAKAYRLKFIENGQVVFIDVDARTGKILSRRK